MMKQLAVLLAADTASLGLVVARRAHAHHPGAAGDHADAGHRPAQLQLLATWRETNENCTGRTPWRCRPSPFRAADAGRRARAAAGQHASSFDLAPQAEGDCCALKNHTGSWDVKPEITRSMIEIGTHPAPARRAAGRAARDLTSSRAARASSTSASPAAARTPTSTGASRRSFPASASTTSASCTATSPKQFTVFGQHVHVAAGQATALWLLHALSRYVPHFIALSASLAPRAGALTPASTRRA